MKHQALFSSKDKSKKIKVSSAAILLGALRVKVGKMVSVIAMSLNIRRSILSNWQNYMHAKHITQSEVMCLLWTGQNEANSEIITILLQKK